MTERTSPEVNIQTCGQCGREVRPGNPWGSLCGPCVDKEVLKNDQRQRRLAQAKEWRRRPTPVGSASLAHLIDELALGLIEAEALVRGRGTV